MLVRSSFVSVSCIVSTSVRSQVRGLQTGIEGVKRHHKVHDLIRTFKSKGHLVARLDPLENVYDDPGRAPYNLKHVAILQKEYYGFTDKDDSEEFYIGNSVPGLGEFARLGEIYDRLRKLFSSYVGVEYAHLVDKDQHEWIEKNLADLFDGKHRHMSSKEIIYSLGTAQLFEEFCGKRFSGAKRFSLEGSESLIPALQQAFRRASELGVEAIELGMAHRGRLNVLRNVLNIPLEALISDFQPYLPDDGEHPNNSDDVRYHLGTTRKLEYEDGRILRVSLAANPSHLEAVNAVVLGKTRARQFLSEHNMRPKDRMLLRQGSVDYSPSDVAKHHAMAILLHGDASFYQGSVREVLGFSNLRDYTTGGTVHVIINNQIGFTTMPKESHSSVYCSDVAKSIGCPIFHVNGDHPELVIGCFHLAIEYRQRFGNDVVIDMWCYRRQGHNEQDNPELTQPLMYSTISNTPTVCQKYCKEQQGEVSQEEIDGIVEKISQDNIDAYAKFQQLEKNTENILNVVYLWNELGWAPQERENGDSDWKQGHGREESMTERLVHSATCTGVAVEMLRSYGRAMFTLPSDLEFNAHPKVKEIMEKRLNSIQVGAGRTVQWSTAESLAFASLLVDGFHIRLSGQDVERGTFNQRHAVLYDQKLSFNGVDEKFYKPWTALQQRSWHREDGRRELIRRHSSNLMNTLIEENLQTNAMHAIRAASLEHKTMEARDREYEKTVDMTQVMMQQKQQVGIDTSASTLGIMEVCNSPLSEEAVLGFEHGYSLYSPNIMTIWEAQFGDFANCAQTIIDTFIASGEEKWVRPSGLVMLLPHGYEGQGPDHSSARLERFLQLCDEPEYPLVSSADMEIAALAKVNMHILSLSTPAQYFHALRRQMITPVRKPLILVTPKSLLHHKHCASDLRDMGTGTFFQMVFDDPLVSDHPEQIEKLVVCTGKIFYHLIQHRRAEKSADSKNKIAIVRVEQLCPFPFHSLRLLIERYPNAHTIALTQEEPKSMGPYFYLRPRLDHIVPPSKQIIYHGRPHAASPATGSYKLHKREMQAILNEALTV